MKVKDFVNRLCATVRCTHNHAHQLLKYGDGTAWVLGNGRVYFTSPSKYALSLGSPEYHDYKSIVPLADFVQDKRRGSKHAKAICHAVWVARQQRKDDWTGPIALATMANLFGVTKRTISNWIRLGYVQKRKNFGISAAHLSQQGKEDTEKYLNATSTFRPIAGGSGDDDLVSPHVWYTCLVCHQRYSSERRGSLVTHIRKQHPRSHPQLAIGEERQLPNSYQSRYDRGARRAIVETNCVEGATGPSGWERHWYNRADNIPRPRPPGSFENSPGNGSQSHKRPAMLYHTCNNKRGIAAALQEHGYCYSEVEPLRYSKTSRAGKRYLFHFTKGRSRNPFTRTTTIGGV